MILPQFIHTRNGLRRETAKLIAYYQENVRHVDNSHLLVRLLLSLNVSLRRESQNYVDVVEDVGMKVSSMLRMTSSIFRGSVHYPGVFYGRNVTEVIIATDEEFSVEDAAKNWRDLRPLRVLRHPFTDMSMGLADGNYEASDEQGLAVIAVNIPMLAFQYKRWEEEERDQDTGSRRRIQQFLAMYPIPNMIYSHMDVALFNRMAATYRKLPVAQTKRAHPFHIVDYTVNVDDFIEKQLSIEENRHLTFDHVLLTMPAIHEDSMFEVMMLPDTIPTRQVKWALTIARLPVIKFLVRLNLLSDNQKNSWYLSQLRMSLREMRIDRTLQQALPPEVFAELESSIKDEVTAYL